MRSKNGGKRLAWDQKQGYGRVGSGQESKARKDLFYIKQSLQRLVREKQQVVGERVDERIKSRAYFYIYVDSKGRSFAYMVLV